MKRLNKVSMLGALIFCICSLQAQIPGYIQGDENYTLALAFHKVDTILVVMPRHYQITRQEKTDIENYVFWDQYQKKPVYIYKTEADLTGEDTSGNIQFYGPFCDFLLAETKNIPVKQIESGFLFNDEPFTRATDSFFYLNDEATRLYTCRNSTQVRHPYANYAAGYFPFYIFRGNDIYLSGNYSNNTGEIHVNYIADMRNAYFDSISTQSFDFELAKPICTDSLRQLILSQADKYLENLCATLKTDTLALERMTTYVYKNMLDLQQFLSMSPRMTIYGKSFGAVNHLSTFDMTVFYHETAHTIIGQKIGMQSNSFFSEGFAVYTGYFMQDNSYIRDFDSTKNHLDLLSEELIMGDNHRFYSLPPMYPVSGVFTRFIIDKIGIETFKAIYAQQNIEQAFADKGLLLTNLIAEFKNILNEGKEDDE